LLFSLVLPAVQMPAPQVNAYYDPSLNSMNFPAGISQPPFFSQYYPSTWNYAALGAVMGHEVGERKTGGNGDR
jgi:predicted metalloendopeptidase